jgi:hypothetical protein
MELSFGTGRRSQPFRFLSPLGERLGEGVQQKAASCITPSPNLSPKGERRHED